MTLICYYTIYIVYVYINILASISIILLVIITNDLGWEIVNGIFKFGLVISFFFYFFVFINYVNSEVNFKIFSIYRVKI